MSSESILIVDDDRNIRKTLSDVLRTKGYHPITAQTTEAVLDNLSEEPALALIDIRLEEGSGLDLIQNINERSPDTECIVLTGYASQASAIQAVNLGAYSYIEKPFDMEHLLLTIQRALEKRAARRATIEQERYFRSLLENIQEDILVIDQNYYIVDVNRDELLTTGHSRDEIVGKRCFEVLHQQNIPCADQSERCQLLTVFETGETRSFHHLHKKKDGEEIWVDILLSPLRNEDGEITHVLEAMRDVTDMMEMQANLRQSERRYRLLAETAQDMIIIHDLTGSISYFNEAALQSLGYDRQEILGASVTQFLPQSEIPTLQERRAQREQGNRERFRYETEIIDSDGTHIPIEVVASPIVQEGKIESILLVARDITQRKKTEAELRNYQERLEDAIAERTNELQERVSDVERLNRAMTNLLEDLQASNRRLERTSAQLKAANEELNDFAYVVSHDLKAPLRGIIQLSNWLSDDYADALDAEGQEMLGLMVGRARRMHDLIEGILQYSRVGRIHEREKEIDLNALVRDVLDLLAPSEDITVEIPSNMPTLRGAETRFRQVFQNLLSNAFKFLDKPQGQVTIICEEQDGAWLFGVADNGPGIAEKYYDKVFQMFQTLAPRDEYESTGVGLALVKKIVETWGGRIWLDSTVGEGSTFYFTFPKTADALSD